MEFLKQNNIRIFKHMWNEDDYHQRTLGFFTNVVPSVMSSEYATKVIMNQIKNPIKKQKSPPFQINGGNIQQQWQ
jgi:hypothetical protein